MRIDKYLVCGVIGALALQACNDDYVDQFDINVSLADATNSTLELTSSDYSSIASNETNKALALSMDPEKETYSTALAEVGSKGYFNVYISAADFLPAYLAAKYYDSEIGSKVTVKYKKYLAPSAYLADFAYFTSYTLTSKDYGTGYAALTPATVKNLPEILKSGISDAESGQKVLVNYNYTDVTTEPVNPTYEKVTEFDGAGNYIIAAQNADGKYVTFGKLKAESYSYGYSVGTELEAEDDVISNASDYVVTVAESDKGYTLLNTWGQYLYMSGTYNSFNVSTSLPSSGADWTIVANGDGTFTIKNVSNGKAVKYTSSYGNYGAYAATTYASESLLADAWPDGYAVQNVSLADGLTSVWSTSAKYGPKATAYVGGTNYASESWVVTSAIDLSSASKPCLSFDWVSRYFTNSADEALTVLVSTDYAGDVTTANWTAIEIPNLPDGKSWTYINSGDLDLSAYKGQKIYIGFKYTSDTKAATVEFKNLTVSESMSGYSDCYLFKETISSNKSLSLGYNTTALYAYDGSAWAAYTNSDVNVDVMQPATYESIGSDSVASSYIPTYLAVNHPYALADDVVAVVYNNGSPVIEEYTFDGSVWESVKDYAYDETTFTKDADGFNASLSSYIEASLTGGDDGGFTTQNVALSGSLTYVWSSSSMYGWKASAYLSSTNYEAEAWLVTPSVNFKKAVAPYMTFDEAHKYLNNDAIDAHFQIKVTTAYSGDVTTTEWTDVTANVTNWSDGSSWDYTNIGEIDLSDFVGNPAVVFAFRYVSTTAAAPTFEIKNFYVREK